MRQTSSLALQLEPIRKYLEKWLQWIYFDGRRNGRSHRQQSLQTGDALGGLFYTWVIPLISWRMMIMLPAKKWLLITLCGHALKFFFLCFSSKCTFFVQQILIAIAVGWATEGSGSGVKSTKLFSFLGSHMHLLTNLSHTLWAQHCYSSSSETDPACCWRPDSPGLPYLSTR